MYLTLLDFSSLRSSIVDVEGQVSTESERVVIGSFTIFLDIRIAPFKNINLHVFTGTLNF